MMPCGRCIGTGESIVNGFPCAACKGTGQESPESPARKKAREAIERAEEIDIICDKLRVCLSQPCSWSAKSEFEAIFKEAADFAGMSD